MAAMEWFTPWFSAPGYGLSRLVLQRALAGVYLVAFLAAVFQFRALLGRARAAARGARSSGGALPRHAEPVPPALLGPFRRGCAWAGAVLAAAVVAGAADAVPLWAAMVMWAAAVGLYLSIVNVGQVWYGFGWESLLLEAGFLAIFLGNAQPRPARAGAVADALAAVPRGVRRRADQAARRPLLARSDLPLLPPRDPADARPAELVLPPSAQAAAPCRRSPPTTSPSSSCPFGLFSPQPVATVAAGIVIVTQLWLVLSGNFAWLNWLTIIFASRRTSTPSPVAGAPSHDPTPPVVHRGRVRGFRSRPGAQLLAGPQPAQP